MLHSLMAYKERTLKVILVLLGAAVGAHAAPQTTDRRRIRAVDFMNFEYQLGDTPDPVRLRDGTYLRESEDNRLYAEVRKVVYGDVTGDGAEEAIVLTLVSTGGTGQFTDGFVYEMRGDTPALLGSLGAGDRADGGIHDVSVRDGRLVVERYGRFEAGGACCPQFVETEELRLVGGKLVVAGRPGRRAYESYTAGDGAPQRVRFLKGSSSATLAGSTNGGEQYILGARAGQTISLDLESEDATASATVSLSTGAVLGTAKPGARWSRTLPATTDYVVAITSTAPAASSATYYTIDLAVR